MEGIKIFIVALVFVFIHSCASNEIGHSKDVNQDEINQGYFIEYDEATDKTEITAFFRFAGANGTTLILDPPSTFRMNGQALDLKETKEAGAYYYKRLNGKLPDGEYNFDFTDLHQKSFKNKSHWKNMGVASVTDTFSHREGLLINFNDDPEGQKEEVTVTISDTANSITETINHVNRRKIRIDGNKLKTLHGQIEISIRRSGQFTLKNQTHAGGYFSTDYRLKPIKSYIED